MPRHIQQRVMREGDVYTLLVETNGPSGFYTEISRTIVFGKTSPGNIGLFLTWGG